MIPKNKQQSTSVHILKLIGLGLLITTAALLSSNFLYEFIKRYLKYKLNQNPNRRQIQKSLSYLKRKKFIAFENKQGQLRILLTKLGRHRLTHLTLEEIKIKPTAWDGQWRILTFDIPESKHSERQTLRRKLKQLGFYHFQRSVFLFPYHCEKEIKQITSILNISPYVHLLTAKRFHSDRKLVKKFNF